MNRFFLSKTQINQKKVCFPADITHQIMHVLRLGEGDLVDVLDNVGYIHRVQLGNKEQTGKLWGEILTSEPVSTEPSIKVSLCFGLTNREKVETILQKATEVGVSAFYPFTSSRSLVQEAALSDKKRNRWERIIREAAEQSRRGRLPVLFSPNSLEACIEVVRQTHSRSFVAWEEAESSKITTLSSLNVKEGGSIALFIGPEGGFSAEEVHNLIEKGCDVVSLGSRILRMETAAIVFPALVLFSVGEL